jgi:6-phosphogluconate dehydrogenase
VVASWLLDLTANALHDDQELKSLRRSRVRLRRGPLDQQAAIETGTPAPVLTTALYERFSSRGEADFANKILSAMRYQFGGHHEKPEACPSPEPQTMSLNHTGFTLTAATRRRRRT